MKDYTLHPPTPAFKEHDVVKLIRPLPSWGLNQYAIGTIVHIYPHVSDDHLVEVEFKDYWDKPKVCTIKLSDLVPVSEALEAKIKPIPIKIVTQEVKDFLQYFATELKSWSASIMDGPDGPKFGMWTSEVLDRILETYHIHLPRPHGMDCADQCRELGLVVGDTIEGTEGTSQQWEQTHRLRLIYLGHKIAVWFVTRRKKGEQIWIIDGEKANWTLRDRNWAKLNNAPLICAGCGLEEGERYPQEPTVRTREDGLPRCAHCESENKKGTANGRI